MNRYVITDASGTFEVAIDKDGAVLDVNKARVTHLMGKNFWELVEEYTAGPKPSWQVAQLFDTVQEFVTAIVESEKEPEKVEHPDHYNLHPSGVECITIVRHMNFNLGNAMKYIWRCGLKDNTTDLEDLKKARWYLDDEISRIKSTPLGVDS